MSLFLTVYRKNNTRKFNHTEFINYLPFAPERCLERHSGKISLLIWQWGSALDNDIIESPSGCFFVQGILNPAESQVFAERLDNGEQISCHELHTSCVLIHLSRDTEIVCQIGLGCGEIAFWKETDDFILISNKIGMFSYFDTLTIRKAAIAQYAGRSHVVDDGTLFDGVNRLAGGFKLIINQDRLHIEQPKLSDKLMNVDPMEGLQIIDDAMLTYSYLVKAPQHSLGLSGGKDSRGILCYLERFGVINKEFSVRTTGALYSPEVLAAKGVMKFYQGTKCRHIISKRRPFDNYTNLLRSVIKSCFASEGNISMADIGSNGKSSVLQWGGHENGFKAAQSFANFDGYVNSQLSLLNSARFLAEHSFKELHQIFYNRLSSLLADMPASSYAFAAPLFMRNSIWVSQTIVTQNIASAVVHPYLDFRITAVLSMVPSLASEQLLLFYMQNKSKYPLVAQPFCNDSWPVTLFALLKNLNINYDHRAESAIPFRFSSYFPDEKQFGRFSRRDILMQQLRGWMLRVIKENSEYFDCLDKDVFYHCMNKDVNMISFPEMYRILALLTCCIFIHYGNPIFNITQHDQIIDDLEKSINTANLVRSFGKDSVQPTMEDYEKSLAYFVAKEHELLSKMACRPILLTREFYWQELSIGTCTTATVEIYFSRASSDPFSSALVAFFHDDISVAIDGFTKSSSGFYYHYIRSNGSDNCCKLVVNIPEKMTGKIKLGYRIWDAKSNFYLLGEPIIILA